MPVLLLIAVGLLVARALTYWASRTPAHQVKKFLSVCVGMFLVALGIVLLVSGRLLLVILVLVSAALVLYPSLGPKAPRTEAMTLAQAKDVLGLSATPHAALTATEIERAYKKMLKKTHPDTGGSVHLTRQVIEAKRILRDSIER